MNLNKAAAELGRRGGEKGGKSTSPAKQAAARENGKKGGPKKLNLYRCPEGHEHQYRCNFMTIYCHTQVPNTEPADKHWDGDKVVPGPRPWMPCGKRAERVKS